MGLISSSENHNSRRRRLEPSSSNEAEMERMNESAEEFENDHNGEGEDDDDDDQEDRPRKYRRHTPFQNQELESYFMNHNKQPNLNERQELGRRLSLQSQQVKFWFQNRRAQSKVQVERDENAILKQQNKEIQLETLMLKEALRNSVCTHCNGPNFPDNVSIEDNSLIIAENHHLREEINRVSAIAQTSYLSPPTNSLAAAAAAGSITNHVNPFEKSQFLELAEKALNELAKLVNVSYPLWIQTAGQGGHVESLNLKEYIKSCPPCLEIKPDVSNSTHYATRASGTVVANSSSILHALMDQNQWVDLFPCIIGKSLTIDIIQADNRTLQMMYAELQPLSPLVPILRVKFLRFCRQLAEGVWAMVDVSVERCHGVTETSAFFNCTRFPSGCIVQDMPNGNCSKVTWIEHLVYEENETSHPLVVGCSSSFGAQRWLASLQRQYQCLTIVRSPPVSTYRGARTSGIVSESVQRSMVGMAHRMMRSFGFGLCSTVHQWQLVQAGETRLSVRDNSISNLGEPIGVVLSATNSVWMPVSHQLLFEFLNNKQLRGEWEESDYANPMQELIWINKSNVDELNRVSLLRKTEISNGNMNQNDVLILQETQSDASGSVIVYAAVDMPAMKAVMSGRGDSSSIEILPWGFSLIPNTKWNESEEESCVMTVAFQILTTNSPGNMNISTESIETMNNLMFRRIKRIKSAFHCG